MGSPSIAMARTSEPHSATSQFFINQVDNLALNYGRIVYDPGNTAYYTVGYCVFGQVISGMSVVNADPYPWPYNGDLRPENTALIIIDMQTDFCGIGGYVDQMGYDLSLTRAPIEPIKSTLSAMRSKGYHIIHTREGHRPDLC